MNLVVRRMPQYLADMKMKQEQSATQAIAGEQKIQTGDSSFVQVNDEHDVALMKNKIILAQTQTEKHHRHHSHHRADHDQMA